LNGKDNKIIIISTCMCIKTITWIEIEKLTAQIQYL